MSIPESAVEAAPNFGGGVKHITLSNPMTANYPAFIFGNATKCDRVVTENSAEGQTLVICGAGPTLRTTAAKWCPRGDQVWGCNSAATWLYEQGHKITHAFTVDQTPQMLTEWVSAPDLEYLVASSVHPHLVEYLLLKERPVTFFHNFVGINERPVSYDGVTMSFEDYMYCALYPATVRAGSGLNAVTRAIDVGMYMGFAKIIILGADCALQMTKPRPAHAMQGSPEHLDWLKQHTVMHADGGSAIASGATPVTLNGTIDGREWLVKPDLMISAVWLVKMKRKLGSRLSIMGDTLPKALMDKSDDYLRRLPTLVDSAGNDIPMF